jgi:hypothetical protein
MKGVELEIPPEIAESLRRQQEQRRGPEETAGTGTRPQNLFAASSPWNELIQPSLTPLAIDDEEEKEDHSQSSSRYNIQKGECQSLAVVNHCSTRPVVHVNIEKLQGFSVTSEQEAQELQQELAESLFQDETLHATAELFAVGVAKHAELPIHSAADNNIIKSSSEKPNLQHEQTTLTLHQIVLEYPDQIFVADDTGVLEPLKTRNMWYTLTQTHDIPVVARLFHHVRVCHRDLLWKYQLRQLLEDWIRQQQLLNWKTIRRQQQLEQLYQVREAFVLRIQVHQERVEPMELAREQKVKQVLQQQKRVQLGMLAIGVGDDDDDKATGVTSSPGLLSAWDDGDEDAFGDDDMALMSDYSVYDDEDECDEGSKSSDISAAVSLEQDIVVDTALPEVVSPELNTVTTAPESTSEMSNREEQRMEQRRQRKLARQQARRDKQLLARKEQADQEEALLQKLTTQEHKVALAIIESLESKLAHVDELLESLQEEEWEDEEEVEKVDASNRGGNPSNSAVDAELSLMDQILAMVLSSLDKRADELEWLQREHRSIKSEWLEHFGKLPSLDKNKDVIKDTSMYEQDTVVLVSEERRAALRATLGIQENVWDEDQEPSEQVQPPRKAGLRPGGRVT